MLNGRKPGRAAAAQVGLFGIVWVKNADNSPHLVAPWPDAAVSGFDLGFVDLRTGFIDHDHGTIRTAIGDVNRDLPRDLIRGFLRIALVAAIETDRVLKPDPIGYVEMKNRHWHSSLGSMPQGEACSGNAVSDALSKAGNHIEARRPH
jgi:hypothetical protein